MTNLTTQWIVDNYSLLRKDQLRLQLDIEYKKEELESLDLYKEIKSMERNLSELGKKEKELMKIGKQLLLSNWIKKFEALDGKVVQLNKLPPKLLIVEEDNIPEEYYTTKTTISIDKKTLKDHIKNWVIIDWCYISEDFRLVIK